MRPERIIALLTPNSTWSDGMPGGGPPVFSPEDAAFALSGLERGPYLLGRLVWAGDESVIDELLRVVLREASKLKEVRRWDIRQRPGQIRDLARVAVLDLLATTICKDCDGDGQVFSKACPHCGATGYRRISDAERAKAFGVPRQNWKRWRDRYHTIYGLIAEMHQSALTHVQRRMQAATGS